MRWKRLLKRAKLHAAWQHTLHYNVARYHARAIALLHEAGAPIQLQEQMEVQRAHYCFACKKNFPTFRGWAVHSFRLHQRINKWRRLQQGSVCLACAKQFPSEARLIRHLKSVKSCADTVASQRLWVEPKPAFGSKMITQQEKQLLLDTWDYTDLPQLPTIPGWTMTIQTKNFLQFCTTVVWTSDDAEQRCFDQLAMHAVCEEELREVQEALTFTIQDDGQRMEMDRIFANLRHAARPPGQMIHHHVPLRQSLHSLEQADTCAFNTIPRTPTKYRYVLHLYARTSSRRSTLGTTGFACARRIHDLPCVFGHCTLSDQGGLVVGNGPGVLDQCVQRRRHFCSRGRPTLRKLVCCQVEPWSRDPRPETHTGWYRHLWYHMGPTYRTNPRSTTIGHSQPVADVHDNPCDYTIHLWPMRNLGAPIQAIATEWSAASKHLVAPHHCILETVSLYTSNLGTSRILRCTQS